jgi:glycosyltransferase involved in cell wall biosynthesis
MSSPRIVVGMGVYNEEQYLRETIPAVLAQTMPDFRVLILDNGSTDRSWDILCEMQERYGLSDVGSPWQSRIMLVQLPTNLPPAEAANYGWWLAMQWWPDCRWFMGQGSDDMMEPDYLEAVLAVADADPSVNCIYSPVRFIGHPERGTWTYPTYDPLSVHQQHQIPGWRAFTRELWDAVGPENTTCGIGSDWEWIVRASVMGVLNPRQLGRPYNSLRIRDRGRVTQSDSGDRPALLRHLAGLVA